MFAPAVPYRGLPPSYSRYCGALISKNDQGLNWIGRDLAVIICIAARIAALQVAIAIAVFLKEPLDK
jgi:hypothetical protein